MVGFDEISFQAGPFSGDILIFGGGGGGVVIGMWQEHILNMALKILSIILKPNALCGTWFYPLPWN